MLCTNYRSWSNPLLTFYIVSLPNHVVALQVHWIRVLSHVPFLHLKLSEPPLPSSHSPAVCPPSSVSSGRCSSVFLSLACTSFLCKSLTGSALPLQITLFPLRCFSGHIIDFFMYFVELLFDINVLLPRYFLSPCTWQCENDITLVWGCSLKSCHYKMTLFQR